MSIRRYARRPPGATNQAVDLFRFDFGEGSPCYFVVLTVSGKSNKSVIGSREEIYSQVRGQCHIWGLRQFKDQRIKPEQEKEAMRRVFSAEIADEL
jgi:hypothetical protein